MTVSELIAELKKLNPNKRIIVSVKEKQEENEFTELFNTYHKGDIEDITLHMQENGDLIHTAYVLEVENSFVECVRK